MKPIVVQPQGGLCNRMRAIAGAISLQEEIGNRRKVVVLWVRDASLNAPFNDLFQGIPATVISLRPRSLAYRLLRRIISLLHYKTIGDEYICDNCKENYRQHLPHLKDIVATHGLHICSCQNISLTEDFSMFKIKPRLMRFIDNSLFAPGKSIIGIHIRRTDHTKSIKMSPTSLFEKKIEEELAENPLMKFYLATDDKQTEDELKRKYGDTIITHKKRSYDRNCPLAIEDAVIDLYHLAHCQKIYGSYWSSFSDTAALWGKRQISIVHY